MIAPSNIAYMVAQNYSHLHRFYASDAGRLAQRLIVARLAKLMAAPMRLIKNDPRTALGLGYATPFLPVLAQYVPRVVDFHLTDTLNLTHDKPSPSDSFAVTSMPLPLLPASLDMVLAAHALECLPSATDNNMVGGNMVWEECWRVLRGEGILIALVAHRPSGWERIFLRQDIDGYGNGDDGTTNRGFTMTKLNHVLTTHGFHIMASGCALVLPPMPYAIYGRLARACESLPIIAQLGGLFGGVAIVVARKTLFAPHPKPGLAWRRPRFAQVSGVASPTARTSQISHTHHNGDNSGDSHHA